MVFWPTMQSLNSCCVMYNNILLSYPEDCFKEATLSCFIYDLFQINQFGRHDCISFGRFTLMAGLFLLHMFTKSIDMMNWITDLLYHCYMYLCLKLKITIPANCPRTITGDRGSMSTEGPHACGPLARRILEEGSNEQQLPSFLPACSHNIFPIP